MPNKFAGSKSSAALYLWCNLNITLIVKLHHLSIGHLTVFARPFYFRSRLSLVLPTYHQQLFKTLQVTASMFDANLTLEFIYCLPPSSLVSRMRHLARLRAQRSKAAGFYDSLSLLDPHIINAFWNINGRLFFVQYQAQLYAHMTKQIEHSMEAAFGDGLF